VPYTGFSSGRAQLLNGRLIGYADNKLNYINKGYLINDMVYSIVNLILDKVKTPEWGVYRVKDEKSLKQYKALCQTGKLYGKEYLEALKLWTKAVDLVEGTSKLHDLMANPGYGKTWNDLISDSIGYNLLTGDDFTAAKILSAGANAGLPQELYCLPSQITSIVASNTFPAQELGYVVDLFQIKYLANEVLHQRTWNPEYSTNGHQLYGMSPLKAALTTIQRSNSGVTAGAAAFDNMGIAGVLYVDSPNDDIEGAFAQANAVKNVLNTEYTGPDNHGKIATSGTKLGWQAIGLSPVDLNIIESEKWDYQKLCNVYRVPPELMGLTAKTYNNAKEAEAALTNRVAMPRLNEKRAALNRKFHTDWGIKDKSLIVDFDPSVFTELRMSSKEVAEWTNQMLMITANEQRELAYMDVSTDPMASKLMMKTDREFVDDYQLNEVDYELNIGAEDIS
jgi:HK97 family phage portal protein